MKNSWAMLAFAAAALAARAATPDEIATMDAAALHKLNAVELCTAYHTVKSPAVREELTRRHGFTRRVWWLVGRDFPDGDQYMTYAHVICMWGPPARENRETTTHGLKRTMIYNLDGRVFRVYLLNDVVQKYTEADD